MIDAILSLPSHMRERLASALESGLLASPWSTASVGSILGSSAQVKAVAEGLRELERGGISGPAAAFCIRAVQKVIAQTPRPDLVWSGPEVPGLHARDTRRVYEELLGSAKCSVWVSTYVFFDGPKAFQVLARRMDSQPDLCVTLLLNIQRRKGDTTAADELVRRFADHFWSVDWPGSSRPRVFYDPRALDLASAGGVLHAKAVVADEELVFVTSANLTQAALERNIELGLLLRDRTLAASVAMHFRVLIERALLLPLPGE